MAGSIQQQALTELRDSIQSSESGFALRQLTAETLVHIASQASGLFADLSSLESRASRTETAVSDLTAMVGAIGEYQVPISTSVRHLANEVGGIRADVASLISAANAIGEAVAPAVAMVPLVHADLQRLSTHHFESIGGIVEILMELRGFMSETREHFGQHAMAMKVLHDLMGRSFADVDKRLTGVEAAINATGEPAASPDAGAAQRTSPPKK